MTYVVITSVVLVILNIYCSGISHRLFYQSKEAYMIEKCRFVSDEISGLEVINSSTLSGIVSHYQLLSTILHFAAQPDSQRQRFTPRIMPVCNF